MLKIQITGRVAEGKTTLALIIEEALKKHGIQYQNLDADVLYETSYPHFQEKRIEELRIRSKTETIQIETVQLRKTSNEPSDL